MYNPKTFPKVKVCLPWKIKRFHPLKAHNHKLVHFPTYNIILHNFPTKPRSTFRREILPCIPRKHPLIKRNNYRGFLPYCETSILALPFDNNVTRQITSTPPPVTLPPSTGCHRKSSGKNPPSLNKKKKKSSCRYRIPHQIKFSLFLRILSLSFITRMRDFIEKSKYEVNTFLIKGIFRLPNISTLLFFYVYI